MALGDPPKVLASRCYAVHRPFPPHVQARRVSLTRNAEPAPSFRPSVRRPRDQVIAAGTGAVKGDSPPVSPRTPTSIPEFLATHTHTLMLPRPRRYPITPRPASAQHPQPRPPHPGPPCNHCTPRHFRFTPSTQPNKPQNVCASSRFAALRSPHAPSPPSPAHHGPRREHQLRPECAQQHAALYGHGLRHGQQQAVALGRRNIGQAHARVAGRGLDLGGGRVGEWRSMEGGAGAPTQVAAAEANAAAAGAGCTGGCVPCLANRGPRPAGRGWCSCHAPWTGPRRPPLVQLAVGPPCAYAAMHVHSRAPACCSPGVKGPYACQPNCPPGCKNFFAGPPMAAPRPRFTRHDCCI